METIDYMAKENKAPEDSRGEIRLSTSKAVRHVYKEEDCVRTLGNTEIAERTHECNPHHRSWSLETLLVGGGP